MKNENEQLIDFLNFINQGYVVSDEQDEDNFVVLVDENREILSDFKPSKDFIKEIEKSEFVTIVDKEKKREYFNSRGKRKPMPLITIYKLTSKGMDLLGKK
ncbi:hypothetical protein GSF12_12550 (plasmid) [Moraxella osloensis]|uniref:Uncharacterized protein n=1 Tax=Faucicola osloensis TaxID=34062 RepID=A0A6P1KJC7_FAUOS|nr:hypothetical protein [Moraxella osloensis]QHG10812.1 hypothetical protein GSF12_12550 [Moraxella osloensis]